MKSIKQSVEEMSVSFNTRMAEFQAQIDMATPGSPTVSSVAAQFEAFRSFIIKALETLQQQVEFLSHQVDSLEMRSRRKILLFHGVAEEDGEDTSARVVGLLRTHLKSELTTDDISRSHRMGRPRKNQTRCVLVKFRDISNRNDVWYSKTALKGTGVIVSEFLTKPRHDVFMAARERLGVRNCFTRDGSVYVQVKEGERRCVSSLADLDSIKPAPESQPAVSTAAVPGPAANKPDKRVKRQGAIKPRV
ncbi:uncharacterized protein LOC134747930 [Cydia strobilella]|uniref:uncharacterized protein LOC134747930 n=1 Tax=Cydia strobilella TaxID=1100964 RepID=UPI0030074E8F